MVLYNKDQNRDYSKCHIQFSYEDVDADLRYIYWRIVPSELPLMDRLINNRWRRFEHVSYDHTAPSYDAPRFMKELQPLTTVEDAVKYQTEQQDRANAEYQKRVKAGKAWPMDIIHKPGFDWCSRIWRIKHNTMNKFKVLYENLEGKTREVVVEKVADKAAASTYVLNNYPDCFRIINVL